MDQFYSDAYTKGGSYHLPIPVLIIFVIGGYVANKFVFHEPLAEPLGQYFGSALGHGISTEIWMAGSVLLATLVWMPI